MFSCRWKTCPISLLFRSFYDKLLAEGYILAGHGIGFSPLFVLAALSAFVYAVYSILFLSAFSPEIITERVVDMPTIEIKDGKIVEPENFFQRFALGNGMHLTLDTTKDAEIVKDPSPNEIYVSKDGIQFVKGQRVELMPLSKLLGTENVTITAQNITDFVDKAADELTFAMPLAVFLIAVPVLFFKYVVLVYVLALFSYVATLFSKVSLPFEGRMRLAAVSAIPVFMFNFFFGTLFGLFDLGMIAGIVITLIYLYFYISQMPVSETDGR